MMLKEKSSKWARLKLVFLFPMVTIAIYAFAHPKVNESVNSFVSNEDTEKVSNKENPQDRKNKNGEYILQILNPLDAENNSGEKRDISTLVEERLKKGGYSMARSLIGTENKGNFSLMVVADMRETDITVFPDAYSAKVEPQKQDYLKIYYYVINNKKYLAGRFLYKVKGAKVFFDRSKIGPEYTEIIEVYGIVTTGVKTPPFYMAMTDEVVKGEKIAPPPPPLPKD